MAVAITVPDINQVLKKMNGRLLPLGWLHFLRRNKIIDRVRVGFLGVKPSFQHTGVAAALYVEHFNMATVTPQTWGEMGWILETNKDMNRAMEAMHGRIVRRYRVYEAGSVAFAGHGSDRTAEGLAAAVRVAAPRPFHARALVVPVLIYVPVILAAGAHRRGAGGRRERARPGPRGLRGLDAHGVLAAPRGLPLRARARPRRAAALDAPRRPPRPPQRPAAARDAALGQRAARVRLLPRVLARRSAPTTRPPSAPASSAATSPTTWSTTTCTTTGRARASGGGCASCTCATTSRTTSAASGSARRTGTGCSGRGRDR